MMVNVRHVKVKNLLSPTKLGADFVINPYIGCPHGCHYCYAAASTFAIGLMSPQQAAANSANPAPRQ